MIRKGNPMERSRAVKKNSEHVGKVLVVTQIGHTAIGEDRHAIGQTARVRTPSLNNLIEGKRRFRETGENALAIRISETERSDQRRKNSVAL